jgi:GntR family transcriptional regulator, carbon starvation induced regulator
MSGAEQDAFKESRRKSLKPRTQSLSVYDAVRKDILTGMLNPGAKLRIYELCEKHSVSNGAVREALSRLSSDGLVTAEPQKGFRVTRVSRGALEDLTLARIEIEGICLRLAIQAGDVDWESALVGSFHRLRNIPERDAGADAGLSDRWSVAHAEFHRALVAACPNRTLQKLRDSLYEQSERYRRLSLPIGASDRDVLGEHQGLMNAAIARDPEIVTLMREHLSLTMKMVLRSLRMEADPSETVENEIA